MKKNKVLVSGGCGFVGREVVSQLLKKDYSVVVLDDFSNSTPMQRSSLIQVVDLDLSKVEKISDIFNDINYCIHLAARVGGIKYMNNYQSAILKDNIIMDTNVISAASQTNTKIVYASTVLVYDQLKNHPFNEMQELLSPKSNYAFSKFVGERLCQVFSKERKLRYSIARISNVYGINQNKIDEKKLHVIPDLVRKISQGGILTLLNGGNQTRTFVHVSDLANALILMMESDKANGEIFNIASNDRYQILEVAMLIWEIMNKGITFRYKSVKLKGEDMMDSLVDYSKISRILGWNPKKSLKETLPEIIKKYQI